MARRAAIVGSGFGGLAVAIRLQALGFETVIFEQRDRPGGCAYVTEVDGHIFDGGPTVITAPHSLEELWSLTGRRMADDVELLPVTPFYRLRWPDGDRFDYDGDLVEQIRARSPGDVDGYLRFVDYSRRVFETGYEQLASTPFLRFWDMMRQAPRLAALRADRSVYATVARFVEDEHLRQALSFHALLVGGNPFETSAIYTLIHFLERKWGVWFPRGGTGALVRALVDYHRALGGELRLAAPVEHIELDGRHHVVHAGGRAETFDLVVSNADLRRTYKDLYGNEKRARRVERLDWSMSLFVLYFGTDRTWDHVAHHTVLFGPRYRELLAEIFHGSGLPEDFSLYLHYPSATDPSLAPPGRGTFYVLAPVPHLGLAPIDWEAEAPRYGERILEALEAEIPGLRRHVTVRRYLTPSGFARDLGTFRGSAFSCAPRLMQSAWFRPHNRDPRIPGLYLVGAGTHPGAGVPGVVSGAKATASVIARDFA
jgi:phytoene desaturase